MKRYCIYVSLLIIIILIGVLIGCGGGSGGTGVMPNNIVSNPTPTPGSLVQVPENPTVPSLPSNMPKGSFKVNVEFPGTKKEVKEITGEALPYNSHKLRVTISGEAITTPIVGERNDLDPSGGGIYTLTVLNVPVGLNTAVIEVLDQSGNLLCHRKHGFYMTPGTTVSPGTINLGMAIRRGSWSGQENYIYYIPQNIYIPVGTTLSFQNQDYVSDHTISFNNGALTIGPIAHATHITQPVTAEVFPVVTFLFDTQGTYKYDGYNGNIKVGILPSLLSIIDTNGGNKDPDNGLPAVIYLNGDNKDPNNVVSTVTFTLTGTDFGASRESVNGEVKFIQVIQNDPNNPWGTVYNVTNFTSWSNTTIQGNIDLPGGKYRIEVTVNGEHTTDNVFFYKGTGTYEVIIDDPNSSEEYTLLTQWGGRYALYWSISDVVLDTSGNVYIADSNNNRIQKFDSTGTFISEFGSYGTGDGQFLSPYSVTVDTAGNIYVTDGYSRIQKFNSSGGFITKWGSYGTDDGQFSMPVSVTVDSSSNVYVADMSNHRIQKFNSNGGFITKWGSEGTGDGQFTNPSDIVIDSSGNVYVADYMNNCIQKFTSGGVFIAKWGGTPGGNDGEFNQPSGITVDSSGNVYVVDTNNQRIQKFNSNGVFITKWGSYGSGDGQFIYPSDVAVDSSGNIYVAENVANRIQKFTTSDGINYTFQTKWTSYGNGDGKFCEPYGISIDGSENVYVTDNRNNRIEKFTSNGVFTWKWGDYGNGDGQLFLPSGISVGPSGNVYVRDTYNIRIQKFTSSGGFITKWGGYGTGNGEFGGTVYDGIVVDSSENVYTTDPGNSRIQKFNSNGVFITKWGSAGTGDGQFANPEGIAVDLSGNVYVADYNNHRIQKFNSNGIFTTKWGSAGTGDGQFNNPRGISVDSSGNVYIADTYNNRIQKFNSDGVFITKWFGGLSGPFGITVGTSGNVYVVNFWIDSIQVFKK